MGGGRWAVVVSGGSTRYVGLRSKLGDLEQGFVARGDVVARAGVELAGGSFLAYLRRLQGSILGGPVG